MISSKSIKHLKVGVVDLEGNNLLPDIDTIHCVVVRDYITDETREFIGMDSRDECCDYLDTYDILILHNGIDFDFEVLRRLWDYEYKGTVIDTLVMSRLLYPDRPHVEGVRGPHSVEAWGKRLGRWKPEHEDWSTFSPEMLHRCKEDTEIQTLIYRSLLEEAGITDRFANIFHKDSYKHSTADWSTAMGVEHKSAKCMRDQATTGVFFKKEDAERYIGTLNEIIDGVEKELLHRIPQSPKQKGVTISAPFTTTGKYKKMVTDWYPHLADPLTYANMFDCIYNLEVNGPFTRIEWNTINLGSDKQVKEWLYTLGWEPDEWNFKKGEYNPDGTLIRTSPKITASSLKSIDPSLAGLLESRSKSSHRRNQIQGFLDNLRPDNRIEAQANPIGTPTCRMTHRKVANIPKANSDKETHELIWYPEPQKVFFGTEMRSLFSVDNYPEWQLIGRDAAGIEIRCFAHYLNNKEYINVILNGDIHSYNQEKAGLPTRDMAKTFLYATLYGAGIEKIGSIVLPDGTKEQRKAAGTELKNSFETSIDGMGKLIKNVRKASRRGYLIGIDGRKLIMRSSNGRIQESKALNTLLQGCGAIIMTHARTWLADQVVARGWSNDCRKVLDYHDEETYECIAHRVPDLRELMVESVVQAGKTLNFNLPLDADAKVGESWANVH